MAMASLEKEEAVLRVVAPGGMELDEEVKKVESRGGGFSLNGAPLNRSFNSRISTDVEMAESQVAIAGSVDSAAEVIAMGPSACVDHHAGPASSGEVVDATEKVESWDLSEAVQEGSASKEDSKPNFSEDERVEERRSSDLMMVDAPTSAASVEDSAAADVEEKKWEGRSDEDVGGGREAVLSTEVVVTEDGSPKVQDEGSAEKGGSEVPEAFVEEVHKVGEATTSAEPEKEGASVEVVPSPSADVEEKAVDVEDNPAAVEDKPVDVEVKSVDVEEKPVDVVDKSVEVKLEDAGLVSKELPAEDAPSEEGSPKFLDQGSIGKGDSAAPESPVEEINEIAKATTVVEPDEAVASLEAVPSLSADVEDKSVDVEDKPVDVEDKPIDVADKSGDIGVQIVEMDSEDAGVVSKELPAVAAASEEANPKDEGSTEKGNIEVPEAPVEEVQEVAEATPRTESDELGSLEALPSSPVDVEQNFVDLNFADAGAVSEDVSPIIRDELSIEKVESEAINAPVEDEVHEVAEAISGAEPDETDSNVEAVPSPSVDVGEKSIELDSAGAGAVSEDVSPIFKDEESVEKVDGEAPEVSAEEVQEVAEPTTSAEPTKEVASLGAMPSPSVDVEDPSVEMHSEDVGAVIKDVSPKIEDEEKVDSETPDAPVKDEVHEVAEMKTTAEPDEAIANLEVVPSPSVDVEEKSVELDSADTRATSEDVSPKIDVEEAAEKFDSNASEPLVEEVHDVTSDTKPDEIGSNVEAVPSPSVDVKEKSSELDHVDPTTSAEAYEEIASPKSVSAPAEDVEDKPVQEADSKDTSEASEVLPPESTTDKEDISPEPLVEGNVETLFVPVEEVHEVVEEMISAELGEVPVEPESALAPSDVEDRSVSVNSGDTIGVTTTSESVDKEGVSPETSSEATISAGADESLESKGSTSLESLYSPANNVEDGSLGVNPEDTSEDKMELDTENTNKDELSSELPAEVSTDSVGSADKEGLSPELPADGSTDNIGSESLFTSVEEVHEVIEETISPRIDERSTRLESGPTFSDVEEKPAELSEAKTTVQPLESVDKKLVSRDLHVEELHAPIEEIGKFEGAATDEESTILESTVASSEDVQSIRETKSREFIFDDLKESLTTSEKEEMTIGEEGSSFDAVARDTTPLDVSSPPPAGEKNKSPNSYDLHEEAVHLEESAEKTLEGVKSGSKDATVAEVVAQIVLDESSKTGDSSELISGVIQHVAQLAQDDFQSDPNVLPDTVNQVFARGSATSSANEGNQPKESSSLGTKFSLFVIWCISLCASHVSSKDMPAPALKLGAEEVAAVLHSNSQGAASSKVALSI